MLNINFNGSYPSLRTSCTSIFSRGNEKLVVVFAENDEGKSVSKDIATAFIETLKNISLFFFGTTDYCNVNVAKIRGILITKNNLTSGNQAWLSQISCIEHFLDHNLFCSISENILSSRRTLLNEEKKNLFSQELSVSISKIPSVPLSKDISYKFYGIQGGDIVKEERETIFPEFLNQRSITYRLCKDN